MRAAAARLLIAEGPAAVTHRRVAAEAGVPAGSAAYYFPSREELYAQAVEAAEDLRAAAAEGFASRLVERRRGTTRTAELLIEALYSPRLTPDVVSVRLEPMISASRTPRLAEIMRDHRPRLLGALRTVLVRSGYPAAAEGRNLELVAFTIESSLLYGSASGEADPVRFAAGTVAHLLSVLEAAGRAGA
jgi:DNA-binding transcriptional regulator YbjK